MKKTFLIVCLVTAIISCGGGGSNPNTGSATPTGGGTTNTGVTGSSSTNTGNQNTNNGNNNNNSNNNNTNNTTQNDDLNEKDKNGNIYWRDNTVQYNKNNPYQNTNTKYTGNGVKVGIIDQGYIDHSEGITNANTKDIPTGIKSTGWHGNLVTESLYNVAKNAQIFRIDKGDKNPTTKMYEDLKKEGDQL